MKLLLTMPSINDEGGVAQFFKSVLPFISENHNVRCFELGSTHSRIRGFHPLFDQIYFRKLINYNKFDLVHVNPSLDPKSFFRDGFIVRKAKQKGLPVFVFFHGWRKDFEQVVFKRLLWLFKITFSQADVFMVLASEFKNTLLSWGVRAPIYLGTTSVEESLLDGFSLDAKFKRIMFSHKISILFLARLEVEKGIFETIDAVTMLQKKGVPVTLSIAGDGPIRNRVANYLFKINPLGKGIKMLGYITKDEKIEAFKEHDIYCLPTYNEGLPTSLIEAMSFGMPIFTRSVGGIADFFMDGRMGYLCKSRKSSELARLLENLINDRYRLIQIGQYNHVYAKKNFMASKVAKILIKIYSNFLSN